MSTSSRKFWRKFWSLLFALIAAVTILLFIAFERYKYLASLAIVWGGVTPGVAAADIQAFRMLTNPIEYDLSFSELKARGRIFTVSPETDCKVVKRHWQIPCHDRGNSASEVRLLSGPRADQVVWMCSDG